MDTGDHNWRSVALLLDKELEAKLSAIGSEEPEGVVRSFKSMQVCKEVIERLKGQVQAFGFESKEDELHFFKEIKPKLQSKLIYFHKLFLIDTGMPMVRKDQRAYLQKEVNELNLFFEKHSFFYQYYRGKSTYLDEKLFLRYQQMDTATMGYLVDLDADPAFSTAGDFFMAKVLANGLLAGWLEGQLAGIDAVNPENGTHEAVPDLTWTASKADIAELIYAFYAGKVFNNGHVNVKQVADFVCKACNVKVGNIYKVFEEIRLRKNKSRTEFIDMLKDALGRMMEEDDG